MASECHSSAKTLLYDCTRARPQSFLGAPVTGQQIYEARSLSEHVELPLCLQKNF